MPESLRREIQRALPAGQPLAQWTDARPIEEELPRARVAMDRGEKALATMFSDVRRGRVPQVDQVSDAMAGVADSMIENPDALLWVAHLRDKHTRSYRHAMRVALYMVALGRGLGFPRNQLASLGSVGLLADIGKTRVPQALLDKPSTLTPEEFEKAKLHVSLGHEMLAASGRLPGDVLGGIFQHHERLDGSGYPNALSGPQIGLFGKMAAIADTYAAMTSSRPYGNPVAPHAALRHLFAQAGSGFHEPLVQQFARSLGAFPVGSLVELTSGEVALVLAHDRARRRAPRVVRLADPSRAPLAAPRELDLLGHGAAERAGPVAIRCGLPAG
ncbi:MAG TPA: HD-GYP domain-containing protein [Burkholderiaceae bacterium]